MSGEGFVANRRVRISDSVDAVALASRRSLVTVVLSGMNGEQI